MLDAVHHKDNVTTTQGQHKSAAGNKKADQLGMGNRSGRQGDETPHGDPRHQRRGPPLRTYIFLPAASFFACGLTCAAVGRVG
ncbi:hypothetical protein, partial [Herbaspirillum lusitanum]|uniref:hypothetical protein n=1 Tax=Herbaspirillum lusitanum TaxID=213312 RepID=UPI001EE6505E